MEVCPSALRRLLRSVGQSPFSASMVGGQRPRSDTVKIAVKMAADGHDGHPKKAIFLMVFFVGAFFWDGIVG